MLAACPLMVSKRVGIGAAIAGGLLLLLILSGAIAYGSDYGVEGTITDKGRDAEGCFVIVTTKIGGVDVQRHLSCMKAAFVQRGFFVVYHVQSGTTEVYTSEGGDLVYRG